jgi:hypothetical protein
MEDTAAQRAAEWLLAEHQAGHRFTTLGPPAAPASISDAYDIQDRYVALLRRGKGEPIGYKVGLTSATMQAFCGIDHPIAGVVLGSRVHRSGVKVRRADFGRLGIEFEIAVRIKSDIPVGEKALTIEGSSLILTVFARRSRWSTTGPRIMRASTYARWWRIIPGMPALYFRTSDQPGPIWRPCSAAPPKTGI